MIVHRVLNYGFEIRILIWRSRQSELRYIMESRDKVSQKTELGLVIESSLGNFLINRLNGTNNVLANDFSRRGLTD